MDKDLVDICNSIYNRHKNALDLIYEYKNDDAKMAASLCKNEFESKKAPFTTYGIDIKNCSNKVVRFTTETLRTIMSFNGLECGVNYYYEMQFDSAKEGLTVTNKIVFFQGKNEFTDNSEAIKRVKLYVGNFTKLKNWKTKTLHQNLFEVYDEEAIKNWLTDCLKNINKKENDISQKLDSSVK